MPRESCHKSASRIAPQHSRACALWQTTVYATVSLYLEGIRLGMVARDAAVASVVALLAMQAHSAGAFISDPRRALQVLSTCHFMFCRPPDAFRGILAAWERELLPLVMHQRCARSRVGPSLITHAISMNSASCIGRLGALWAIRRGMRAIFHPQTRALCPTGPGASECRGQAPA